MNRLVLLGTLGILSLCATGSEAQTRGWINVDGAYYQAHQDEQTFSLTTTIAREIAAAAAVYPKLGSNPALDLSGGVGLVAGLGVAVHFDAQNYTSTVGLGVSIPSPYFFNTPGVAGAPTASTLERKERALDISALYLLPTPSAWAIRIFGGPTYFSLKNQMVNGITYNQIASPLLPINIVTIRSYTSQEVSGSSLGFHVGGDVGFFFTRHVGIGGGARLNRGQVTVTDPLSTKEADLSVGHAVVGGGLRLRF